MTMTIFISSSLNINSLFNNLEHLSIRVPSFFIMLQQVRLILWITTFLKHKVKNPYRYHQSLKCSRYDLFYGSQHSSKQGQPWKWWIERQEVLFSISFTILNTSSLPQQKESHLTLILINLRNLKFFEFAHTLQAVCNIKLLNIQLNKIKSVLNF